MNLRTIAARIGIALVVLLASCGRRPMSIRYRVEGVIPETWSGGPYRSAEAGELLDSHGDSAVPRRYGSIIKTSPYVEQSEAIKLLIRDVPSPHLFRRTVETRRGIKSLRSFDKWLGEETMRHVKRVTMEAMITRERVVHDLPLVERTLNVVSDVDDDYESLRRAALLDSEQLRRTDSAASGARFWFCERSAEARSFTLSLMSKNGLFSDTLVDRVRNAAESWLREHLVDARVAECRALSAGDVLMIRLEGKIGIRIDMLPILAARDGTLMLISDPTIQVARIYR